MIMTLNTFSILIMSGCFSGFSNMHLTAKKMLEFDKKKFLFAEIEANDTAGTCRKSGITFPPSSSSFPNLYLTTVSHPHLLPSDLRSIL